MVAYAVLYKLISNVRENASHILHLVLILHQGVLDLAEVAGI